MGGGGVCSGYVGLSAHLGQVRLQTVGFSLYCVHRANQRHDAGFVLNVRQSKAGDDLCRDSEIANVRCRDLSIKKRLDRKSVV